MLQFRGLFASRLQSTAAASLAAAVVALPALSGLWSVWSKGLAIEGEQEQWLHVAAHERRFVQAITSGSALEGDDASTG